MFTIAMVQPQTPASVFSSDLTQTVLDQQIKLGYIGKDNVPVYVSSITYGRLMQFTFTAKADETFMRTTLQTVFSGVKGGVSVNLSIEQKTLLSTAEIGMIALGGSDENALAAIRSGNIADYFATSAPLTTARPLSYEVRNLGDNSIASIGEATNYNIEECAQRFQKVVWAVEDGCGISKGYWNNGSTHCGRNGGITLPAGSYFLEPEKSVVILRDGGARRTCDNGFSGYFVNEDGANVPASFSYDIQAHTHGGIGNSSAERYCRFSIPYITPNKLPW
jgi:hypothetical protein